MKHLKRFWVWIVGKVGLEPRRSLPAQTWDNVNWVVNQMCAIKWRLGEDLSGGLLLVHPDWRVADQTGVPVVPKGVVIFETDFGTLTVIEDSTLTVPWMVLGNLEAGKHVAKKVS